MNYKMEKVLKDSKKYLIIFIILWLLIDIVFIAPLAVAVGKKESGQIDNFINEFISEISTFTSFTRIFNSNTIGLFGKYTLWMTIIEIVLTIIGMIKGKPKSEYTDIENGSSDWSEGGEQYKILSRKKGIILAENNFLPVDKRGNVNVLVVGRFGFW